MLHQMVQQSSKASIPVIMNPSIAIPLFIGICTVFLVLIFWFFKRSVTNFDDKIDDLREDIRAENQKRVKRDKELFNKLDKEINDRNQLEKTVAGLNGDYVRKEDCNDNYRRLEEKLDRLIQIK